MVVEGKIGDAGIKEDGNIWYLIEEKMSGKGKKGRQTELA